MDLTPILVQLRSQVPSGTFRQIGGAIELDAAIQAAPVTPCVYVMPLADQPDDPFLASATDQFVRRTFSAVICVSNRADATGGTADTELQGKRQAVRAALLGWTPEADPGDPISYRGGRLLRFEDGRLWWADEYQFMTRIN